MKPSRKERKRLADQKRSHYELMIAEKAKQLVEPKSVDQNWGYKLNVFIIDIIRTNPLDAHLIRQSAYEYQRKILKAIAEGR